MASFVLNSSIALQWFLEDEHDRANTGPVAPAGDWYKDTGSFVLCRTDQFPKTVLDKGMKPFGSPVV